LNLSLLDYADWTITNFQSIQYDKTMGCLIISTKLTGKDSVQMKAMYNKVIFSLKTQKITLCLSE